ncbi:MAG: hypothetical protein GY696_22920 [Gammaproteobacteria bacterium]|nr:hypothetical protein [Gammaproteobacteria bacterium]
MRAEESAKFDDIQLQAGDSTAKFAALKRTSRKGSSYKSPGAYFAKGMSSHTLCEIGSLRRRYGT